MKIAIVVGHSSQDHGARAVAPLVDGIQTEWLFNDKVADEIIRIHSRFYRPMIGPRNLELKKFHRVTGGGYSTEIRRVYRLVNDWGADASMELHFNAASPSAKGALMLSSGSTESMRFATILLKHMVDTMQHGDRGVEVRKSGRGSLSLTAGRAPAVLTEPFFGTNREEVARVGELGIKGFAGMYYDAIKEFAKVEIDPDSEKVDRRRNLFGETKLSVSNLSKNEFFSDNHGLLQAAVDTHNELLLEDSHGEPVNPVSLVDVIAVMNAEMGAGRKRQGGSGSRAQ